MYKRTIIFILLILCALGVRAEDSIKVSATDLKALMQRVERLEQAQANPNKLGVDAVSGASQQIPKDTIKPDTIKGEQVVKKPSSAEAAPSESGRTNSITSPLLRFPLLIE